MVRRVPVRSKIDVRDLVAIRIALLYPLQYQSLPFAAERRRMWRWGGCRIGRRFGRRRRFRRGCGCRQRSGGWQGRSCRRGQFRDTGGFPLGFDGGAGSLFHLTPVRINGVYRAEGENAPNGRIMRCTPVAVSRRRDPERLIQDTADTCAVSHYAPESQLSRTLAPRFPGPDSRETGRPKGQNAGARSADAMVLRTTGGGP